MYLLKNIYAIKFNFWFEGYKPSKTGWYVEGTRLKTENKVDNYASLSSLQLQNFKSEIEKLVYTCRTENFGLWSKVEITVNGKSSWEWFYLSII